MSISSGLFPIRTFLLGLAAAGALALSACGGGGGGGSDNGTGGGSTTPPTSGSVAILLTDAPTDSFCHILARVESIDLLNAAGERTTVYTGPETIDLLALRNFTDFFAVDPVVPIGQYEKIRMTLSDLALVQCDAGGVPEPESQWEHPHLPGNGKLDFNPRGTFEVIGGETLVIELDMDMNKSLFLHQTGNGRWQFRPVVFVTVQPDHSKLVRVFGRVRDRSSSSFELCPVEPVSSTDADNPPAGTECIDVFTDGQTGIFDAAGLPVGLSAVANDGLLTAIGFLGLHDDADADTRMDDLKLDAAVLELGPQGTFERIQGAVVSAPGNNDIFEFDSAPLDPATGTLDVLLQSGTHIFALGSNAVLTSAALQPGTTGEVDGVFADLGTPDERLRSSLIVLDQDTTPEASVLGGTIAAIDADDDAVAATRRFTVDTATVTGQCVKTDAGTRYLQISESPTSSETTEIVFADLAVGNSVDVYGTVDPVDASCVLADTIQKYVTAP